MQLIFDYVGSPVRSKIDKNRLVRAASTLGIERIFVFSFLHFFDQLFCDFLQIVGEMSFSLPHFIKRFVLNGFDKSICISDAG